MEIFPHNVHLYIPKVFFPIAISTVFVRFNAVDFGIAFLITAEPVKHYIFMVKFILGNQRHNRLQ